MAHRGLPLRYLSNSQRAQVMNNGKPLVLQSASGDSSRAGQWDNSQFFLGFSNKTYGTLTGGRVNALSLDGLIAYDPMGSAYAFSPFGFTGMYAGFSDTELARSNTAIKYRGQFGNFRVAGLAQIGGYNQGNGSTQMWQGQVGGDIHNLYGGTLSLDFVGSYAVDGALTSNFTTPIPKFYSSNDLKATLSNNVGYLGLAKYTWGPAQLFAGWNISVRAIRPTTSRMGSRPSPTTACRETSLTARLSRRSGSPPTLQ